LSPWGFFLLFGVCHGSSPSGLGSF
jgi:hypothetical protein